MAQSAVIRIKALGFPWETADPFLFCVHHQDFYPKGNADLGPDASLAGRNIGQDFVIKDGWRMYHGDKVPGFPVHPHRGFETVTVVRTGIVDHADSLGAAGRYGGGDTQWMTAGKGVQHSEMFPLLHRDADNPLELFQIWLNLPAKNKMVEPHFKMLWRDSIPRYVEHDEQGKKTEIEVIAGCIGSAEPVVPPPDSWAADPDHQVAIWVIKMDAGALWTLPARVKGLNRTVYVYQGKNVRIDNIDVAPLNAVELISDRDVRMQNGKADSTMLLLQGQPINESVAQHGPFVMNTREEIQQAFVDYQQTQFGGWPWEHNDQTHGNTRGRFAKHVNGYEEEPGAW